MQMSRYITISVLLVSFASLYAGEWSGGKNLPDPYKIRQGEAVTDTIPLKDRQGNFVTDPSNNPFDIMPSVIEQEVEYDPESGNYIIFEVIERPAITALPPPIFLGSSASSNAFTPASIPASTPN